MIITITPDDILRGFPGSCSICPVAIAIERVARKEYGLGTRISVASTIVIYKGYLRESVTYLTPYDVWKIIERFDRENIMYPFSFKLGKE